MGADGARAYAALEQGRITLLGDACHPILPFLGQGGVMAIEDGYVIAACLAKYFADPATALARYEEIRKERSSAVVRASHENRKQVFSPALAAKDAIAAEVERGSGGRSGCASASSGSTRMTRPRPPFEMSSHSHQRPRK